APLVAVAAAGVVLELAHPVGGNVDEGPVGDHRDVTTDDHVHVRDRLEGEEVEVTGGDGVQVLVPAHAVTGRRHESVVLRVQRLEDLHVGVEQGSEARQVGVAQLLEVGGFPACLGAVGGLGVVAPGEQQGHPDECGHGRPGTGPPTAPAVRLWTHGTAPRPVRHSYTHVS